MTLNAPHTPPLAPHDGTWWVLATGPSIEQFDLASAVPERTIVVSDNYLLMPHARACYAPDLLWWQHHYEHAVAKFRGELWSTSGNLGRAFPRVREQPFRRRSGLCQEPGMIHCGQGGGQNAALQAMALCWLWDRAQLKRIVLAGVDLKHVAGRWHWFGDHPKTINKSGRSAFPLMRVEIEKLVADLARVGVRVTNLSPYSVIAGCDVHAPVPAPAETCAA